MAMTLTQTALRVPGPSWDEEVKPALRKRAWMIRSISFAEPYAQPFGSLTTFQALKAKAGPFRSVCPPSPFPETTCLGRQASSRSMGVKELRHGIHHPRIPQASSTTAKSTVGATLSTILAPHQGLLAAILIRQRNPLRMAQHLRPLLPEAPRPRIRRSTERKCAGSYRVPNHAQVPAFCSRFAVLSL